MSKAKQIIEGMESLTKFSLHLNKDKSQILRGPTIIKEMNEILGVPIKDKVKYLGYTLSPSRQ